MSVQSQIFIDIHPYRTRVAMTQGGELVEFYVEANSKVRSVGNIYRGRVINVVSGMQAAFVNIGLDKNAYLYVGGSLVDASELASARIEPSSHLTVSEGDEIMVQVVKDQSGTKGARITQDVSLAGRYLVYMPYVDYIGISRKIEDEELRNTLYGLVENIKRPSGSGFVVRTAAATATQKELRQDAKFLVEAFENVRQRYDKVKAPSCVYDDGDLVFRTIRDMYTSSVSQIVVNSADAYAYIKKVLRKIAPGNRTDIILYNGNGDLFKECNLDKRIELLLKRKVRLESGAYLIIDKTEALTVIDVNTGKFIGNNESLEETVFETNVLAAREIARQVRLRNIGGIIIVDFIDMHSEEHRAEVITVLEMELKKDRIKTTVVGMTGLGLVEITRKKTRNDTQAQLMQVCPYCGGDGVVYSFEYVIMKIRVAIIEAFANGSTSCIVYASPSTGDNMFKMKMLQSDIADRWKDKTIYVVSRPDYNINDFEVRPQLGGVLTVPDGARLLY